MVERREQLLEWLRDPELLDEDLRRDILEALLRLPRTRRMTYEEFLEYARAGIPEYWLIDPATEQAEFYVLDERGRYRAVLPDAEGIYRSRAIEGFWLRESWLWKPPRPLDVLRELGVL